jgi:drug/metabolite transporter (DMT)-like permease
VAFVIGLAGVLLLSAGSLRESSLLNLHYLTGNLFILAGLCGSAFYNVYCKGLFARFQQLEVLVFSYIAASLAGLPLVVWAEPFGLDVFRGFGWQSWLSFGYQAIVTYGVAMLVFFRALKHLDVTVASLSLYMLPAFGLVLAAIFLHERLSGLALGGGAIVLAATMLIVRYDKSNTRPAPAAREGSAAS